MQTLFAKIKNNKFFISIATLMSGSLIVQAISILISPIMTRIYTETQIGQYTLLLTAVTMFGSIMCGRYDMSIVSEEEDKNVLALIKLCLVITLVLSIVISVGYSVYFRVTDSIQMNFFAIVLLLFILLMFSGVGHILISYNNRNKDYKLMASVQIIKEVGKASSLIGLGLLKFGTVGLIISYLTSSVLGMSKQSEKLKPRIREVLNVSPNEMIAVANKHKKQPLCSLPASFANSFSYSVINIFINHLFGTVALAYYSMSFRMLGLPLSLVSVNVSKPFFEKASREYDQTGRFSKTFIQTTLFLLAIAVPMTLGLILLAPWAFELFFGEGWSVSGQYVRYLAPMFGIRLIVGSLTPTMIICNKQNVDLGLQICFVMCSLLAFLFFKNSIEGFLIVISILFSIVYIVYYIAMLKLSFNKRRREKND